MRHVDGNPVRGPAGQKHRGDRSGAHSLLQVFAANRRWTRSGAWGPLSHPLRRQARCRPAHAAAWSPAGPLEPVPGQCAGWECRQVTCCPQTPRSAAGQTPFCPRPGSMRCLGTSGRGERSRSLPRRRARGLPGAGRCPEAPCVMGCGVPRAGESESRRGSPGGSDPRGASRGSCGLQRGPQALSPVCVLAGALLPPRVGGRKVLEVHRDASCTEPVYLTPLKCTLQNSEKW